MLHIHKLHLRIYFHSYAFAFLLLSLAPQDPQVVQQQRSDEQNMITITDTTPHSNKARMDPGNRL